MVEALRAWTPRQWAAVKWLVVGLWISSAMAFYTWSAFASAPGDRTGYGWVEWSPCHHEWANLKYARPEPVSDAAAAAAGCPHGEVQLP